MSFVSKLWRVPLGELSTACRRLSQHLNLNEGDNRRVQWDLQPRVIRYYTTLGLLDRACEKRGKAMYYGSRHLFQLLSIKKLQSQGHSLADVQARLLGATDQEMIEFLELPSGWLDLVQEVDRRQDFWLQPYRAPAPESEALHRLKLPNGVEIVIPAELWERNEPESWMEWLAQAPN